jgi:cytochrome c-type biogenesis protein CcmH/NrfG
MECNELTKKSRSRTRVCGLAVICILAGIIIWYIARPPVQASAVKLEAAGPAAMHAPDAKRMTDPLQQDADKQTESLLARLRNSPDDPFLLAEIGKIYYQMRRFPMAAKYYEDSVRLKPDAVVLIKLGGAYHFSGHDDKAIGVWNHALRLDPDNPDALFNIGFVEWRALGNPKAAIAAWQQLLRTNPNHPKRAQVEVLLAQAKRHLEMPMARNE